MTAGFGEYRSARESRDWVAAWTAANNLEGGEREAALRDWWRCADLDAVARLIKWSAPDGERGEGRDALWWMDKLSGQMTLGGVEVATHETLDLNSLAVKWARIPAEAVAHIHREWALIHDPGNAGVTQEVFAALDSGDLVRIEAAARAAADAAWAAADAADASAAVAARTAWAAADASADASAAASADAAADAALAAWAAGNHTLPTRAEWAHRWAVHVLQHLKEAKT